MAQQGGENANRKELLAQSFQTMDTLLEQYPENEELYLLRAQAALLQGELDQLAGVQDAESKAQRKRSGLAGNRHGAGTGQSRRHGEPPDIQITNNRQ